MKKIFKIALVAGAVLCVGKLILALKESADYVPERWTPDFSGEGYDSCGKRKDVSRIEIVVKNATDGSSDAPDEKGASENADSAVPSTCSEAPDGKPDEHDAAEQKAPHSKSKRSVKSKDAEEGNNGQ